MAEHYACTTFVIIELTAWMITYIIIMITKFFKFVADLVIHSFAISLLCFVGFGPSSKATQRERVAPFAAMGSFLSA